MDFVICVGVSLVIVGLVLRATGDKRSTVIHSAVGQASMALANDKSLFTNLREHEARDLVDWAIEFLEDRVKAAPEGQAPEFAVALEMDSVILAIRRINAIMGEVAAFSMSLDGRAIRRKALWVALMNLLNEVV